MTFDPVTLNKNSGLLRAMTNYRTTFEDSRPYPSPVIDRKPSIYRPTDRHIDRQTDMCKATSDRNTDRQTVMCKAIYP